MKFKQGLAERPAAPVVAAGGARRRPEAIIYTMVIVCYSYNVVIYKP